MNQIKICVKFDPFPETISISQLKILEKYMRFKGGAIKVKLPFKILGKFGEKHPFWLISPKKGEWIIALSTKRPILANH